MAEPLSDKELRAQLIALGEKSIGPITNTTRAIYRKKLNHLKAAEKKAAKGRLSAGTSRKLTALSSDDSEGEVDNRPSAPARGRKSRSTRGRGRKVAEEAEEHPVSNIKVVSGRRSLRSRRSFVPEPESTEEELEEDNPSFSSTSRPGVSTASLQVSLNNTLGISNYDSPDSIEVSDTDLDPTDFQEDGPSATNNRKGVYTSKLEESPSFWSRWMTNNNNSSQNNKDKDVKSPKPQSTSTPDVGRLLRHRVHPGAKAPQSTLPSKYTSRTPSYSKSTTNNVSNHVGNHHPKSSRSPDQSTLLSEDDNGIEREFKTEEDPSAYSYTLYISKVLVITVALFFLGLALVYLTINGPSFDSANDRWLTYEGKEEPGVEGYSEEQVTNARQLITQLYDMLSVQAGEFECGTVPSKTVSIGDLKKYFKAKLGDEFGFVESYPYSLGIAIRHISENQHWSIRLLDIDNKETNETDAVRYLVSDSPTLSLWCRVQRSATKVIYTIFLFITVMMAVLMGLSLIKWWKKRKEAEAQKVYELVEKIIDILKVYSDSCQAKDQEPFMAIPHVRDMLIPPKERRKKQALWDKAVHFLSENESRIRVETQKISGEEFEVWRWLPSCANGGKVWQGQAFGDKDSGLNYPTYSLTPCLKIRNMFDADMECEEDWHVRIQDAILEKCPRDSGIVHIAVDKNSREGCVYVKCLSADHAGKCYKALHGWWFDGSLVTVKYLRLERYHERFPHAKQSKAPLVPSNNERRSLSQPFHRSIIESS